MPDQIKIDTQLFIDIITSEDGIVKVYDDEVEGDRFEYYRGKKGIVSICVTDEFLSNRTAKAHMRQLGIDDLIIRLFPPEFHEENPDNPEPNQDL